LSGHQLHTVSNYNLIKLEALYMQLFSAVCRPNTFHTVWHLKTPRRSHVSGGSGLRTTDSGLRSPAHMPGTFPRFWICVHSLRNSLRSPGLLHSENTVYIEYKLLYQKFSLILKILFLKAILEIMNLSIYKDLFRLFWKIKTKCYWHSLI